jgi:hypothetical protein
MIKRAVDKEGLVDKRLFIRPNNVRSYVVYNTYSELRLFKSAVIISVLIF